jgi:phosphatidylglycerophosphate synthase
MFGAMPRGANCPICSSSPAPSCPMTSYTFSTVRVAAWRAVRAGYSAEVPMEMPAMTSSSIIDSNRRPIKSRSIPMIRQLAVVLARLGVRPNEVSCASMVFAAMGAACMSVSSLVAAEAKTILLMFGAAFIQLRLLCNLLDGLIAVEGGQRTSLGELFNEMPDRVSDSLLLVAAGYASGAPDLGWAAALFAMATAYVRSFAAQSTQAQDFCGPMAKQHRMFVLTFALIATAVLQALPQSGVILSSALILICVGSAMTCLRRLMHYVRFVSSSR